MTFDTTISPTTLSSQERLDLIQQARNIVNENGELAPDELRYTLSLIREERATHMGERKPKNTKGKKAQEDKTPSLDDF